MKRLRGFAIVSAIFILVVLAALGAFILNISSSQQIGSALDVQGVRAYQAARAGIEWGLFRVQSTPAYNFGNPPADPNGRRCPGGGFGDTASFAVFGFTVTVVCEATTDANSGPTIYALTSTACSEPLAGWTATIVACPNTTNPGPLYIERRLTVTF
jgi:MSHA biogenesis protein MshP